MILGLGSYTLQTLIEPLTFKFEDKNLYYAAMFVGSGDVGCTKALPCGGHKRDFVWRIISKED